MINCSRGPPCQALSDKNGETDGELGPRRTPPAPYPPDLPGGKPFGGVQHTALP